jgi:hypothetical protein
MFEEEIEKLLTYEKVSTSSTVFCFTQLIGFYEGKDISGSHMHPAPPPT